MKKTDLATNVAAVMTQRAIAAIENDEGNRAYGANTGIEVGNIYHITGIDFREAYMCASQDQDEVRRFNELSDSEKAEQGVQRKWFEFLTDDGTLSFGAVLGNVRMYVPEFWKGANVIKGFNVKNLFKPSCRRPAEWMKQGCDGLIGKKLQCVGIGEVPLGTTGRTAPVRGFVVL